MSNTNFELLQTVLCVAGLAMLTTGAIMAFGWSGAFMLVGALFFVIFLTMLT